MNNASTIGIINTGSHNTVTPSEIVSLAKSELGLETTDQNLLLERWVFLGLNSLDCPSLKKRRKATVDVCCDEGLPHASIPCGLYYPIMVIPHCGDYTDQYVYADTVELDGCGCNKNDYTNVRNLQKTYQFTDNNIVLHNVNNWTGYNESGEGKRFDYPKQLDVYFWGANVDKDGFVRIYNQYELALVSYLCWRYARRSKGKYGKAEDSWFAEFKRERATLISSERKVEADLQRASVKSLFTALVVNPRCSITGFSNGFW